MLAYSKLPAKISIETLDVSVRFSGRPGDREERTILFAQYQHMIQHANPRPRGSTQFHNDARCGHGKTLRGERRIRKALPVSLSSDFVIDTEAVRTQNPGPPTDDSAGFQQKTLFDISRQSRQFSSSLIAKPAYASHAATKSTPDC